MATTVYYLEMLSPGALRPKPLPQGFEVAQVAPPCPELNRRLYQEVGRRWEWTSRLSWPDEQWRAHVLRPTMETWVGRLDGREAGYFELEVQAEGNVEIAQFGLREEFIGRGLGGPLLTAAVRRAWAIPHTRRVWLHTCTKDHPPALENYRRRGFALYRSEPKL